MCWDVRGYARISICVHVCVDGCICLHKCAYVCVYEHMDAYVRMSVHIIAYPFQNVLDNYDIRGARPPAQLGPARLGFGGLGF